MAVLLLATLIIWAMAVPLSARPLYQPVAARVRRFRGKAFKEGELPW